MIEMNPILQYEKYPTRGKAIKAMCAHCMGCTREHMEPGFRQCIRDCTSEGCPLHRYRPFQKDAENADTVAA